MSISLSPCPLPQAGEGDDVSLREFYIKDIDMSYYEKHVFFCTNVREDGGPCCTQHGAQEMRDYAKKRIKALDLNGAGKIRINSAGCLDRCDEGPVLVVYPEAVWYTYVDQADIDEIVDQHLVKGKVVERLKI